MFPQCFSKHDLDPATVTASVCLLFETLPSTSNAKESESYLGISTTQNLFKHNNFTASKNMLHSVS